MRLPPRTSAAALAVLMATGVGACSSSSKSTTTGTTAAGSATTAASTSATTAASGTFKSDTCIDPGSGGTITIKTFKFSGCPLQAKAGDSITVTNADGTDHSVTADDGSFDTDAFSSGSKTIKVSKAGTFTFHCKIHNFMTGEIIAS